VGNGRNFPIVLGSFAVYAAFVGWRRLFITQLAETHCVFAFARSMSGAAPLIAPYPTPLAETQPEPAAFL